MGILSSVAQLQTFIFITVSSGRFRDKRNIDTENVTQNSFERTATENIFDSYF